MWSVQISALNSQTVPSRVVSPILMALHCLIIRRTPLVLCRRQRLRVRGSISITASRPLLNSTTRGTTVDQRSGGRLRQEGITLMCVDELVCRQMKIHTSISNLTSPQDSNTLLQHVSLAGLVLAWIFIDYRQVLIPVTPVDLVHPVTTRHCLDWRFSLYWHCGFLASVIRSPAKNTWSTSVGPVCHPSSSQQSPSPRLEKTCGGRLGMNARCPRWLLPTVSII